MSNSLWPPWTTAHQAPLSFTISQSLLKLMCIESVMKRGPLEKGMANHSSILASRTPWTVWKGKKTWHQKMSPPRWVDVQYATGEEWRNSYRKNEEAGQKQKQCQLWMCLVVTVKSNAVKSNTAWEPGILGPWIKVNWMWSGKRWQEWILTFLESVKLKRTERENLTQMTIIPTTVVKNPSEEIE